MLVGYGYFRLFGPDCQTLFLTAQLQECVPMAFKTLPTAAYWLVLPVLLALGNWQLNRADEKQQVLALQAQQANSAELALSASTQDDVQGLRYKKVRLRGHYDVAHQFLLDNQIHAGKAGYFVLTPFVLDDGSKAVLVNRGWLPLTANRSVLPALVFAAAPTAVAGRVNQFPSVGLKLAGAEQPGEGWPSLVQLADSAVLAKKLGYPLFSFQIELDPQAPDGYLRDWHTSTLMLPEQHRAYALQWFGLAFTLTVLFIVYRLKKQND
jgi:surfeit locus 1 family protein